LFVSVVAIAKFSPSTAHNRRSNLSLSLDHHELVFEVHADVLEKAKQGIRAHMTGVAQLAVPLVVDIGVGDNWDEAH
jgi:DNA polymerase I-like protein with 3'-5' exonuclease and polymerase domains